MDYVDGLSDVCRVLLFDYPQELRTNQELVVGMHAFFQKFGIKDPIFIGASDGGMVAQIYTQKYPDDLDFNRRHGCQYAQESEKKVPFCAADAVVSETLQL